MKKYSMQEVLFHFSMSMSSIKIQLVQKSLGNIKNCLELNLWWKKKEHFAKHFAVCKNFLESQQLVVDLVDF